MKEEDFDEIEFDLTAYHDDDFEDDFDLDDFEQVDFEKNIIFPENFESFSDEEKLDFFSKNLEAGPNGSDQDQDEFLNQIEPSQLFTNLINYTLLHTYGANKLNMILHYFSKINELDPKNINDLKQIRETLEKFKQASAHLSKQELYLFHHLARHEEVFWEG